MNFEEVQEFDKLKTVVLKYVLYKKRSELEVREKFSKNTGKILDDVIEYLKENNYIDDNAYIKKSVNEFKRLKDMSIKEIEYKLLAKGIKRENIKDYVYENREELLEYEFKSAENIFLKKQNIMEKEKIIEYLQKKGYMQDIIKSISNN